MATTSTRSLMRPGGLVRPGITSAALPSVEIDSRTAFDFLISACNDCGELDDMLPQDRAWAETSREALREHLGDGVPLEACSFVSEIGRLLVEHPEVRTARETVAAVDALSEDELITVLVGELLSDPELGETTRRAIDGDDKAFADLQSKLEGYKGHAVLTGRLRDLTGVARRILHFWLPLYEPLEDRIGRMLDRDVVSRRANDAGGDPIAFTERTTNGIRLVPEPQTRRIVLAPTYFGRPYNSMTKVGDAQLIVYPIADSSLGASDRLAPPNSTVRLYRALGDESRLRILKLLAEKDRYLTEIANELELSKPTIKHHLAQLRSAGLVTVTDQGNMTYYSIRHDRADEAGVELRAFLAH